MGEESGSEDEEVWNLLAGSAEDIDESQGAVKVQLIPDVCGDELVSQAAGAAELQGSTAPAVAASTESVPESRPVPSVPAGDLAREVTEDRPSRPPRSVAALAARGSRIPMEILEDPDLNEAIQTGLPASHNFEVHRTVWRLRRSGSRHVGLQMPEGLQQWALVLADIFSRFVPTMETTTILGDVTFGACCIDDLGARAVGVDFLVHYGHSCIVPTDQTTVSTLYVHVEVEIDAHHLVETVRLNFSPDKRLAFMGTVQFTPGVMKAVEVLRNDFFADGKSAAKVPQVKPLSVGETLGCTSPTVEPDIDAVVFVCDGRFHLESAMIQNPSVKSGFFRYDPFYQTLTRESFAHSAMHGQRKAAIEAAKGAEMVGLILSTLGRQGSSGVLEGVERLLEQRGIPHLTVLLSDVSPERLTRFEGVGAWVQVACPRLSIDWGDAFDAPLLTPYEAHIAFGDAKYQDIYPMDYYSNKGGPWSNYGAHNGHGGSLDKKFRHLSRKRLVEYEDAPQ
eukprot:CAMPEP_0115270594 /NCGR_PEP_ID=MMETSP0270-20121206/53651_1 /TAXON_ID=71861 /ORGANISM="Scrippsiella trochoidea, Strain CCMP3099" /LENGTH=506 /DNA_ID=CAMNT_0002686901 /DNA_START=86 /DNA_END=1606 /DNA_ORIENTATION=-